MSCSCYRANPAGRCNSSVATRTRSTTWTAPGASTAARRRSSDSPRVPSQGMRIRLDPEDDLLHQADDDPNFNESRYYSFFQRDAGFGGWVRMGNRPNERYAEMTVCLYLPDGRVGFMFERPVIEGHTAHD